MRESHAWSQSQPLPLVPLLTAGVSLGSLPSRARGHVLGCEPLGLPLLPHTFNQPAGLPLPTPEVGSLTRLRQKVFQEFHTPLEAVGSPHAPSASASSAFTDKGSKPVPPSRVYRCPRPGHVQCSESQEREIKNDDSFPSGPLLPALPRGSQVHTAPPKQAPISELEAGQVLPRPSG